MTYGRKKMLNTQVIQNKKLILFVDYVITRMSQAIRPTNLSDVQFIRKKIYLFKMNK